MRQKTRKPLSRKPAALPRKEAEGRRRRNAREPQVIVPQQVDLPLVGPAAAEIAVPAAPNGRSPVDGRL